MLSAYLIRTIENHADDLTREVLDDLGSNPRIPSFHRIPKDELRKRVFDLYHNLGDWLAERSDEVIENVYAPVGRARQNDGIPLSEVVYALALIKGHLCSYILQSAVVDSAVGIYQEEQLNLMIGHFFDKAVYHMVRGYEAAQAAEAGEPAVVRKAS